MRDWRLQLGSLGSGNHFIEMSADEHGEVWFFPHSGLRGIGNRIAQHHVAVAHTMMSRHWISLPDKGLAYLVEGSPVVDDYMADRLWARAIREEWGLIPGSIGTAPYVVAGQGNVPSINSSPHGAVRVYSRSAARRAFTQDDLRASMVGIEYRDTDAFINEIPAAYKDIDRVMADASDLVEIQYTLRQVVNVKGD